MQHDTSQEVPEEGGLVVLERRVYANSGHRTRWEHTMALVHEPHRLAPCEMRRLNV